MELDSGSDSRRRAAHIPFMQPTAASKTLVILLIIVSVLIIGMMASRIFGVTFADKAIKRKQYQALFLSNGQVYFGKLDNIDTGYVKLRDIYYLQVQQAVQPPDNKQSTEQPQVSLAKLGNELHGPEDVMYVARDQVLFWENLKNDGKVVTAIKEYQASQNK